MFDDETPITAGDLVPDFVPEGARILFDEDENRRVWLVREGNLIQPYIEPKNLTGLLDANAAAAAEYSATGRTESMTRVATIPSYLYFQWKREGRIDDPRDLLDLLNDSDYAKFRTTGHRL